MLNLILFKEYNLMEQIYFKGLYDKNIFINNKF